MKELEKIKVGIVGISPQAGASFLAASLAKFLSATERYGPAVVELGSGSLYDSLGMDKHFAGRRYCKFFHGVEKGHGIRGKSNIQEGINWVLKSPEEWDVHLNPLEKLGLVNAVSGNVILCDFSGQGEEGFQLLQHMDGLIVVIDPLPSKMLQGYGFLQNLKVLSRPDRPNLYVINKYNGGVSRKEMESFIRVEKPIYMPLIQPEMIYRSEYGCKIPYCLQEIKLVLEKPLKEIVTRLYQ